VFTDEGAGKYNPSPQILEEAAVNEWPGRDVGVFVSIGTGKRPSGTNHQQHEWWEGFVGSTVGSFAEARRRLIAKIEACEDTHIQMMNQDLPRLGIPLENYCRMNVEVGVGEFGMNEWDRLSEMTTSTRRYLKKTETQAILENAAIKMAKIEITKRRMERGLQDRVPSYSSLGRSNPSTPTFHPATPAHPGTVELPAEDAQISSPQHQRHPSHPPYPTEPQRVNSQDKYMVVPDEAPPPRVSAELPYRTSQEKYHYQSPTQLTNAYGNIQTEPPPRPPKTPINEAGPPPQYRAPISRPNGNVRLPYPDDGPPPIVSKLRKPEYTPR
jgi:hypothetical protein